MLCISSSVDLRTANFGTLGHIRFVILFLLLSIINPAAALDIAYCSSQNTGASFTPVKYNFQSNGACHDTCVASYAFAVVQDFDCWCADNVPANTVSVGLCNEQCPGYPNDTCGAIESGLFGYIALDKSASGTNSPAGTTISTQGPVTVLVTVKDSITVLPSASTTLPPTSPISASPSLTTPSTTSWSPTPYVSIITITGEIHTIIVTPTAPPPTETVSQILPAISGGFWSNTGAVAGIFVAVALIVLLFVVFLVWFFLRRHRLKQGSEKLSPEPQPPTTAPNRLSLLAGWSKPLYSNTRNSLTPLYTETLNRAGPDRTSETTTPQTLSRPLSTFIHDQRLDPRTLFNPALANGSRTSVNTFHDNQDYSRRVLHVANPDN